MLLLGLLGGCGRGGPVGAPPLPPGPPRPPASAPLPSPGAPLRSDHAREIAYCVEQTNAYRASAGRAALTRSPELDVYAAVAAQHDGQAHVPHAFFTATSGGGVALAENTIPWWSLRRFQSVHAIVQQGLAMMWDEGPGGGHYDNMVGPYSQVGCGVFMLGDEVTVVQALR